MMSVNHTTRQRYLQFVTRETGGDYFPLFSGIFISAMISGETRENGGLYTAAGEISLQTPHVAVTKQNRRFRLADWYHIRRLIP